MDRLRASEWLQIAETELDRSTRFLEQEDIFSAYCLGRAAEACLFAFLVHCGEPLESDVEYDLEELLRRAASRDRELQARGDVLRSVAHLSELARHPVRPPEGESRKHMLRAIEAALNATRPAIEHVRNSLRTEGD